MIPRQQRKKTVLIPIDVIASSRCEKTVVAGEAGIFLFLAMVSKNNVMVCVALIATCKEKYMGFG